MFAYKKVPVTCISNNFYIFEFLLIATEHIKDLELELAVSKIIVFQKMSLKF